MSRQVEFPHNIMRMRRPRPLERNGSAGFSLIYVLIALVILSVGTLGIAAMMAVSVRSKTSAYSRAQASYLAYTILDRMRANRATALQHGYDIRLGAMPIGPPSGSCLGIEANCSPSQIAGLDLLQWKSSLAETLPSGDGSIRTVRLGQITQVAVTIQWNDRTQVSTAESSGGTAAPVAATASFNASSGL